VARSDGSWEARIKAARKRQGGFDTEDIDDSKILSYSPYGEATGRHGIEVTTSWANKLVRLSVAFGEAVANQEYSEAELIRMQIAFGVSREARAQGKEMS
jgi:hypothetical protein